MTDSFMRKHPAGSNPAFMKAGCAQRATSRVLALVVVSVLLLLGHAFGAEWRVPPPGQPNQIRSQVNYDPKLSDPFFESEKWTNGNLVSEDVNGLIVYSREECPSGERKLHCLKNTARCFSSLDFEHTIDFCQAKLLGDDSIELFIHDDHSPIKEYLTVVVQKGAFWSQYWFYSKVRLMGVDERRTWTTKKQTLTLDKQVYRKGDSIKGRIDFECVEEMANPKVVEKYGRSTFGIKVKGVFKAIVE